MKKATILMAYLAISACFVGAVGSAKADAGELQNDINTGKSIMWLMTHPDDEIFSPGVLIEAGAHGNNVWVVNLISIYSIPPAAQHARRQAINWFRGKYLTQYINLNMTRDDPEGWHHYSWSNATIRAHIKGVIESRKPDVIVTSSPMGFIDHGAEHAFIGSLVTSIWANLSYSPKPKIYWIVNTGQVFIFSNDHLENESYPPTAALNLNAHSSVLNRTYWQAKVEFWFHYAQSVPPLLIYLQTPGALASNDHKEYFFRYQ